jgi:hypothetical protein
MYNILYISIMKNIKLIEQTENNFNNKLVDVFHFLTVYNSHYFLAGSSNLRNILYNNDYDLNQQFNVLDTKEILTKLYQEFLNIFENCNKNKNYFIIDFKNGIHNKEPIRWNYDDMKLGYKLIDGHKYTFQDCLTVDNNTIKQLDIIFLLNNKFTSITNIYFITFVKDKKELNKKHMVDKNQYTKNLIVDIVHDCIKDKDYFKAIKRYFSLLRIENDKMPKTILDLFNSDIGLFYHDIFDLSLCLEMLEQTFKPVSLDLVKDNLQIIKQDVSKITDFKIDYLIDAINSICNLKDKIGIKIELEKLIEKCQNQLNKMTKSDLKLIKV